MDKRHRRTLPYPPAMMSLKPSVIKGLIHVLCAFVLFAQQAALTHVVSHLPGTQPAHEQEIGQQGRDHSPASELASLCAFDAAFGQVLGGGPTTHHSVLSDTAVSQTALHRSRACTAADALTPRSRGPPPLL
jgi:hypothetical protein